MIDGGLLFILIFFMLVSWIVSNRLKKKFRLFSEIPTSSGLSGKEIAEKMLADNGIYDVSVISVAGQLTDHYNPAKKSINLSEEVYHGRHVAAAAVAAHETGHAVQHATAYSFLSFRSAMVPLVAFSSKLMNIIFILSILGGFVFHFFSFDYVLITIIAAQGAITLFSLVTLPVEFDASHRALIWLNHSNITVGEEYDKAKNALQWAAGTYVVSALAAITTLIYWVMMFLGRRD